MLWHMQARNGPRFHIGSTLKIYIYSPWLLLGLHPDLFQQGIFSFSCSKVTSIRHRTAN